MPSSRATDPQQPRQDALDPAVAASEQAMPAGGEEHPPADAPDRTAELEAELARLDDRYKRALADLDNFRKRTSRETERRVAEERERLLRDWLEALDSVERALRMQREDEGLRAVLEQMEAILARHGVMRLGKPGETFDPAHHEAVSVEVTDRVPAHTIVEVVRSGFALNDERVLRPAQVVVSRRPAEVG
jgi:molecular chaperone GrpE